MSRPKSKAITILNQKLIELTPDPYDIVSTRIVNDGWSYKAEIVFTDGNKDKLYSFPLYGNDESDMCHLAIVAARRLLLTFHDNNADLEST
jgi:hypothetical protein